MSETMLERYASERHNRGMIEDFLDGLVSAGHIQPVFHSGREAALDKFFAIDRVQLEKERRQIIAACREAQ